MKRLLSFALSVCLWFVCATPSFTQLQDPTPPINLIIDSDMAYNCDDVGDHAVMWALANRGEVNVLALIASSANDYSAPAMRAIANYYGHPNVPIGAYQGSIPGGGYASSAYTQRLVNVFGTPGDIRANYPEAVTVYRQALASAPDNSVYIVMGGFYEPLQAFLQSPPDAISPLSGVDLARTKVRRLIPAAGWFPGGQSGNFVADPDAASYVFANWPGEIVSVGDQIGGDVPTAPSANSDPNVDPVKFAYNIFNSTSYAWTQAALLYAARGVGTTFSVGGYNGQTVVKPSTDPQFPAWDFWSQTPNAGHSYILKQIAPADMSAIINPLLQSSSNMPILRSISPQSVQAGSPGQAVTLTGTNFFSDSQVSLNGSVRPTTFVSGTQLSVQVSSSDLSQVGSPALSIFNGAEGNWTSNKINLNVLNAVPSLSSISPASVPAGSSGFTLTANGSAFNGGSILQVNGANRVTNFISGTQLTAAIPASDVTLGAYLSITVLNPGAGGGTSGAITLTVNNPVPAISSVSPNPVTAMGSTYTLTVAGSGFNAASIVKVDGKSVPTTLVNSTQLNAQVANSDLLLGQHAITVVNPAPGGGTSNAVTVTVISTSL